MVNKNKNKKKHLLKFFKKNSKFFIEYDVLPHEMESERTKTFSTIGSSGLVDRSDSLTARKSKKVCVFSLSPRIPTGLFRCCST